MKRLFLPFILTLAACYDAPGQWASIVYPDASDRGRFDTTYRFKSESTCRQAAKERIAALPDPSKAAYECVKKPPPER
jgi:hypothetical protein